MSQRSRCNERSPELHASIDEAGQLVALAHGTNLDPIIDALDARLLDDEGRVREELVGQLRPELIGAVAVCPGEMGSGRQVAASLLCPGDESVLVPILGAAHGGVAELVPVIAVALFGSLNPPGLPTASVLAALLEVRGLREFCQDMGRGLQVDHPRPSG